MLLQTRALGMLPATDSSVIVATEPLWAAGLASVLLSETLDKDAQIGGAMILAGCLANTLLPEQLLAEAAAEAAEATRRRASSMGRHAGPSSPLSCAEMMRGGECSPITMLQCSPSRCCSEADGVTDGPWVRVHE